MKALVMTEYGRTPQLGSFPDPEPGAGEVVVEMIAAGVHPIVRRIAAGTHYGSDGALPRVPGVDGVARMPGGHAAYVGFARAPYGTLSERTVIPSGWSIPLPDGCDPVLAAGALNPAMSGWVALTHRAEVTAGQRVLVLGATGASGRVATQLALELGARVVAVGRSPSALAELAALRAETVSIAGPQDEAQVRLEDAVRSPPHAVLDYLWGSAAEAVITALNRTGLDHASPRTRWVQLGDLAGDMITLPAAVLRATGLEILGSGAGSVDPALVAAAVPQMLRRVADGSVKVPVRAVSLDAASEAWAEPQAAGRRLVVCP